MWCLRMLKLSPEGKYADVMERALYNNVISGISQDGQRYFYVNPLEVEPQVARYREDHKAVNPSRVKWFGCACCPPNITRTLCELGTYVYTRSGDEVHQHLYIGNEAVFPLQQGGQAHLLCETEMPWQGRAKIVCSGADGLRLRLRIPSYAKNFEIRRGGSPEPFTVCDGYAIVQRPLENGDILTVNFEIQAEYMAANPRVTEDCGKAAVVRGPLVYCAEQIDNFAPLNTFCADTSAAIREEKSDLFGGIMMLEVSGTRLDVSAWDENELYRPWNGTKEVPCTMKLLPYFLWNNRGEGEMLVWMRAR